MFLTLRARLHTRSVTDRSRTSHEVELWICFTTGSQCFMALFPAQSGSEQEAKVCHCYFNLCVTVSELYERLYEKDVLIFMNYFRLFISICLLGMFNPSCLLRPPAALSLFGVSLHSCCITSQSTQSTRCQLKLGLINSWDVQDLSGCVDTGVERWMQTKRHMSPVVSQRGQSGGGVSSCRYKQLTRVVHVLMSMKNNCIDLFSEETRG